MADYLGDCYACGEPFAPGDEVVVLETYKATLAFRDVCLDGDSRMETAVHAEHLLVSDGE